MRGSLRLTVPVIFALCSCAVVLYGANDAASSRTIDVARSVMTVHVFKAGLFSALGHEHEVSAPIQEGAFNEEKPEVALKIDARKLRVIDQGISEKERSDIQSTMLGPKVLDSEKFPEIRFQSTQVDRLGAGKWLVHGDLTLHGETRPVKVELEGQNGHYSGSAVVRQKDFGITPVVVAGGTVKVKNEVRVQFQILGK
jgi:polyisoprenoid-binding protein YceI